MKAEHRKELQTNVLANWLGKTVQGVKGGRSFRLVWLFVILAAGAVGAWYFYDVVTARSYSSLWVKLEGTATPGDLAKFAQANRGTMPARVARFQQARLLLQGGLERFASPEDHSIAVKQILEARALYEQLAVESAGSHVLVQECWLAQAKAEESLVGVKLESGQDAGDLGKARAYYLKLVQYVLRHYGKNVEPDEAETAFQELVYEKLQKMGQTCKPDQALQVYEKLVTDSPQLFQDDKDPSKATFRDETAFARSAAIRARELREKRADIQSFYENLNKQLAVKRPFTHPFIFPPPPP